MAAQENKVPEAFLFCKFIAVAAQSWNKFPLDFR